MRTTTETLRDKTIDFKMMYTSNYNKQNYSFCNLKSLVVMLVQTHEDLLEVPKANQ